MAVYFINGELGQGKTLAAVRQIEQYLIKGKRVATNLDLFPENFLSVRNKNVDIVRLPDKPRVEDLELLGTGDYKPVEEYNESQFGALVLDELATWMNTRSWTDKSRAGVIDWFLHARKMHWDVYLIVQSNDSVDKQLISALCQYNISMTNICDLPIPIIGKLIRFGVKTLRIPNLRIGTIRRKTEKSGPALDRWWFNGSELYSGYMTGQCFTDGMEILGGELVDMRSTYCLLSPWLLKGRYLPTRKQVILNIIQSPQAIYAAIAASIIINLIIGANPYELPDISITSEAQASPVEQVSKIVVQDPKGTNLEIVEPSPQPKVVEPVEPVVEELPIQATFGEVTISGSYGKAYILRTQKKGYLTPSETAQEGITTYYRDVCDGDIYFKGDKLKIMCTRVLDLAEYRMVVRTPLSQPSKDYSSKQDLKLGPKN